jgi:hypothetical protein
MTMAQELENLAKQLLDAAHYCTQLEKLEDHCREIARKLQAMAYGQPQSPQAWCQPMDNGKHAPRTFIIYFEDRDRGIMVFDREDVARQAFEQLDTNWNCYLFGAMPDTRPDRGGK